MKRAAYINSSSSTCAGTIGDEKEDDVYDGKIEIQREQVDGIDPLYPNQEY